MSFGKSRKASRHAGVQRGMTLIELMVSIVVGMICVLVIMQLLVAWAERKRTTAAGNDVQISGALGSYALDRDIRQAGFGFGTADKDVMGCAVAASNSALSAPVIDFNLVPVEITKGAGADPDVIRVLYGNSAYFVSGQRFQASTDDTKTLKSREGFRVGDRAIVAGNTPTNCELVEITGLASTDAFTLEHKAGVTYTNSAGVSATATFNSGSTGTGGTTFATGQMFNLGPSPVLTVWAVNRTRGTLTRYNRLAQNPSSAEDVVADVVTLKAQYGYDTSGNGQIEGDEWVDVLPAGAQSIRILALRFGLLMRSRQYERPHLAGGNAIPITTSAPKWAQGDQAFAMTNVDATADMGSAGVNGAQATNNWRNYRYRVYDAVVPLKNMLWGTAGAAP